MSTKPVKEIKKAITPTTVALAINPLIKTKSPTTKILNPRSALEPWRVRALPVRVESGEKGSKVVT